MDDFYIALGVLQSKGMPLRRLTQECLNEGTEPRERTLNKRCQEAGGAMSLARPFSLLSRPTLLPRSYLREHHFFAECWNGEGGEFVAICLWKDRRTEGPVRS
jgi:hypothetical protein